eukprot:scaffold164372_cov35-Tisochrysis_lutea.AAC.1
MAREIKRAERAPFKAVLRNTLPCLAVGSRKSAGARRRASGAVMRAHVWACGLEVRMRAAVCCGAAAHGPWQRGPTATWRLRV